MLYTVHSPASYWACKVGDRGLASCELQAWPPALPPGRPAAWPPARPPGRPSPARRPPGQSKTNSCKNVARDSLLDYEFEMSVFCHNSKRNSSPELIDACWSR